MKPFHFLCITLVMMAAGCHAGSASADQAPALADQEAREETTDSGSRRGRFFSLFNWLGLRKQVSVKAVKVPHVQTVHRPIKISPVIILKPGPIVKPVPTVKPVECKSDSDCSKGYHCFAYKCVQCTEDEHCVSSVRESRNYRQRCVQNHCVNIWLENITKCTRHSACPSGHYCTATGKCEPYVPVWLPCSSDESCQSNSCLQGKCAECSHWRPCGEGQFCDHGHCKNPGNQGDKCWLSLQCKSHICWNGVCADCAHTSDCDASDQYCEKGQCKSLLAYGARCSESTQCSSRICDSATRQCVDCRSSMMCSAGRYCSADLRCVQKGLYNDLCLTDSQCLSNRCRSNKCVECVQRQDCHGGTQFCDLAGICQPLGPVGQLCASSDMCQSPLKCSPITNKCVQCLANSECPSSQRCDNTLGTCVAKSPVGNNCIVDSDCQSGVCGSDKKCVLCRAGVTFGSPGACPAAGQHCTTSGDCVQGMKAVGTPCESGESNQCATGLECTDKICTIKRAV